MTPVNLRDYARFGKLLYFNSLYTPTSSFPSIGNNRRLGVYHF